MFGADRIQRFNGHFFRTLESLPLEPADVQLLIEAARLRLERVEPSIFGTLLVRALDPVERHKLGAEYTPREYIERLVEPTVLEPLRARWTAVQARVKQLEAEAARETESRRDRSQPPGNCPSQRDALAEVQAFHAWLRWAALPRPGLRQRQLPLRDDGGGQGARARGDPRDRAARRARGDRATELDPRRGASATVPRDRGELVGAGDRRADVVDRLSPVLARAHGGRTPPIPILEDTGTIECRDAILAWDEIVHRPEKDRPDPTPRIVHPVTGELVPDPEAKLPYMEYVGARQAEWPRRTSSWGIRRISGQADAG